MADIPGLIEGAHRGAGLGDEFLRHIERTRIIVHLVDVGTGPDLMPPDQAFKAIRNELADYSPELASKSEIVVATKIDLTGGLNAANELASSIGEEVHAISAVEGKGLNELTEIIWSRIDRKEKLTEPPSLPVPPHRTTP